MSDISTRKKVILDTDIGDDIDDTVRSMRGRFVGYHLKIAYTDVSMIVGTWFSFKLSRIRSNLCVDDIWTD